MTSSTTSRLGTAPEEGCKAPCVTASTSNLTLSGEQTIGSVAVVAGNRVLVAGQTDTTENGIYDVATTAWTRSTDWNKANDVISGMVVPVSDSTKLYQGVFTGDFTAGTTSVTFTTSDATLTSRTYDTIADIKALNLAGVPSVQTLGHTTVGAGGAGFYRADTSDTVSANDDFLTIVSNDSIRFKLVLDGIYYPDQAGAVGDGVTDDYLKIKLAIDSAEAERISSAPHSKVVLDPSKSYLIGTGLVIPTRFFFDNQGARVEYSGSGVAFTLGDGLAHCYHTHLINLNLYCTHVDATGVQLLTSVHCKVEGYMEGNSTDATLPARTNVGVEHVGSGAGAFHDLIEVRAHHWHVSFQITYGTKHPTQIHYQNCMCFGDSTATTPDLTSIGFNFQDSAEVGIGDGTKIIGGNIEACHTGIYFGANSREIYVNTRFENAAVAGSRQLDFDSGCAGGILIESTGINSANLDVDGGVRGFQYGGNNVIRDRNGNIREGGSVSAFAGYSAPIRATDILTHLYKPDGATVHITTDVGAGTGEFFYQPGAGSASYGGFLRLSGNTHATRPGECNVGPSQGKVFNVQNGSGGSPLIQASQLAVTNRLQLGLSVATEETYNASGSGLLAGKMFWKVAREVHTLSLATTSDTTTISIPSGAILLGAQFNVDTATTNGGDNTWSAAFITGSTTTLATAAAAALDTKVNTSIIEEKASATTQIRFTPQAGSFTAGVIEVLVYYRSMTSMLDEGADQAP